jgi:hypothetical protein
MTYTVTTLINRAYNLSGVVSKDLQSVSGSQASEGFDLLNALLSVMSVRSRLIPFYQEYDFNTVIGQEIYFAPNLILAETLTFNIGVVKFPMSQLPRDKYHASGRVDNVISLPGVWTLEKTKGGANIYMYPLPSAVYAMALWGKFSLASVPSMSFDLETVFDDFYIEYLRFALANSICTEYNISLQPQSADRLAEMERDFKDISPPDLSMTKISTLRSQSNRFSWADAALYNGWRPI